MRAIRIHQHGGPEAMVLDEPPTPEPGEGQVRVRVAFAGLNFIDVYHRTGYYDVGELPATLGKEGAGVVEAVGPGVTEVAVGDRVCFWDATGSYAEEVVIPAAGGVGLLAVGRPPRPASTTGQHKGGRPGPPPTTDQH